MLEVTLLGQFDVRFHGNPVEITSRPLQLLLAYLMLNAGQALPREKVAGVLWPDSLESTARKNLRNYVWRLRKVIGEDYLAADKTTVSFCIATDYELDVETLRQAGGGASPSASSGQALPRSPGTGTLDSTQALIKAVSVYRGELLPGHYDDWVQLERERLQAVFERQIKTLLDQLASEARWSDLIAWSEHWIAFGQTPEPAYRSLMIAHAGLGDLAAVATSYRRCKEALAEALGVEPSTETQSLFERLSQEERPLAVARPPPCPYRGLSAFREEDAPYFFGRELFTRQLVAAVHERPLVAVVGPSGSGKTSVVFAGLLAQLRQQTDWIIATFRPGSDPFPALAATLRPYLEPDLAVTDPLAETRKLAQSLSARNLTLFDIVARVLEQNSRSSRLLLVADQFEELYTLCPQPEARHNFLDLLLDVIELQRSQREPTCTFVFTLRADFLEQVLAYRPLADAIQDATVMLGPMVRTELRHAIEKPAEMLKVAFETGLVERILDDVGEEPGNLPLLEFALTAFWEQQQAWVFSHNGYEASNRVDGALARHADQTLAALKPAEQEAVRRILIQLIRPGEGTDDTRRIAMRQEFDEVGWNLVQRLADARLVTTGRNAVGDETVEIIHEALIRNWQQLREWMAADRSFRLWQERLRGAVNQWQATDGDEGTLLRGVPLTEAVGWLTEQADNLSQAEQEFILASAALRDRQKARRDQERLARERLRQRITGGAIAGLVITLALALLAGIQWQQAAQERQVALEAQATAATGRDQAQRALSRQLAALTQIHLEDRLDLALLLSLEAVRIADTGDARSMLRTALISNSHLMTYLWGHTDRVSSASFSPDGQTLASGSNDDTILLWDVASGQSLGPPLVGHRDNVLSIAFSPDGQTLASGSDDHTIILWDAANRAPLGPPLTGHTDNVLSVAFSPNGRTLASASGDNTIRLWDISTVLDERQAGNPSLEATLPGHKDVVSSVAFSPDGQTLASGSNDRSVILWDVAGGEPLGPPLAGHSDWVRSVAFSPDGQTLASASENGTIIVWDMTSTPFLSQTLKGHTSSVRSITFSPRSPDHAEGHLLASGGTDNTILLWDVASGQPLAPPLTGHSDWVRSVAFSPDGQTLASASHDRTIALWNVAAPDLDAFALGPPLTAHTDSVQSVAFSPDGQTLASGSNDKTIILWNVANGEPLGPPLTGHTASVRSITFAPDSQVLASASDDNTIILWDAANRTPLGPPLTPHADNVLSVAFSPNGRTLASASGDNTIRLWDVASGRTLGPPLAGHTERVQHVTFSPDGQMLASSGEDKSVILWDLTSAPRPAATLTGHRDVIFSSAFSPDGRTLASSSWDKTIILWDVASGQTLMPPLDGHTESVQTVAFSPDGRILASGSWDETIILWDVASGEPLGPPLGGHTGSVRGLTFSPDGQTLASAGDDRTIILWDMSLESWQVSACRRANRNLSKAEWQQFFGEQLYRATCPDLWAPEE